MARIPRCLQLPVPGPLSFDSPALHPASWTARGLARGGREGAQPERGLRRGGRLRKAAGTHLLGSGQEGGPSLGKPFSSPTMHPLPASSSVCGTQGLSPLVAAPNRKHHRRPGSVETPTGRGDVLPCGKEPVARMKQCPSWCQHCKSENKVSR